MPRKRLRYLAPPKQLRLDPCMADAIRFLSFVSVDGHCWLWQGYKDPNGYGRWKLNGANLWAHRASYAMFRGTIPTGREIDHIARCRNPSCVRPSHLKARTPIANATSGGKQRHQARPEAALEARQS